MLVTVDAYVCFHPGGKRVNDRNANAVKAAGNLVGALVEFTARVQAGQNEFERADAFAGMNSDGNSATVILYADNVVFFKNHEDPVAMSGHCLVDTVIHDFIHQMM